MSTNKITYTVRKLNNGLPVLMAYYPDSQTITIGVSFNVGGRNEWKQGDSYDGISHFLEHQFFKGNNNLSSTEVNQAIDELGGITNAFTTKPVTCYFTKCLKSETSNAIKLWSELLTYGKISQEEFDKEAFVVKQEFNRGEDNPIQYLFRNMGTELHRGTSLEMNVIGNEKSLSTVTLEEMEKYREKHYDLSNAVLMLLGNFNQEEVFNELNNTFGNRSVLGNKPQQELTVYEVPTETSMKVFRFDKQSPLGLFALAIKTPGGKSEDFAALEVLISYMTLGKSSVLQEKLVRSGLSAFAFADTSSYEDIGDLFVLVGAPPPMLEQAHNAMITMLYEVLTMEITEELLNEICDRIEFDLRKTNEEPIMVLFNQSLGYWSRGKFTSLEDTINAIRGVTIDKYNEVRNKVLKHLKGVYLMMGTIGDFFPTFPDGTFDGKFE